MALSALFIYINRKVQHQNGLFLYSFWLYCCCLKLGMRAPFRSRYTVLLSDSYVLVSSKYSLLDKRYLLSTNFVKFKPFYDTHTGTVLFAVRFFYCVSTLVAFTVCIIHSFLLWRIPTLYLATRHEYRNLL